MAHGISGGSEDSATQVLSSLTYFIVTSSFSPSKFGFSCILKLSSQTYLHYLSPLLVYRYTTANIYSVTVRYNWSPFKHRRRFRWLQHELSFSVNKMLLNTNYSPSNLDTGGGTEIGYPRRYSLPTPPWCVSHAQLCRGESTRWQGYQYPQRAAANSPDLWAVMRSDVRVSVSSCMILECSHGVLTGSWHWDDTCY